MRTLHTTKAEFKKQLRQLLNRNINSNTNVAQVVTEIIKNVTTLGDSALINYTSEFDNYSVKSVTQLQVSKQQIQQALNQLNTQLRQDLELAIQRVRTFHQHQLSENWQFTDKSGVTLGQRINALDSVGLYIPGGKASYPSSIIMNTVPAQVAGVERIVMVSPAPNGQIKDIVLATAGLLNISEIYKIGGAQAIATLSYGTQSISAVDKIVGPGNIYVAEAKRQVFGKVGIDMIAGPSEVVIITDDTANPEWMVADLFAQAEHDEMAMAILISASKALIQEIQQTIGKHLENMPKKHIIQESLNRQGALIHTQNLQESIDIANEIAAEHLELCLDNPQAVLPKIRHAGAIFMGQQTPEAFGDYLAGSNHVLPTSGSARFSSPLGVYDFQKISNTIQATNQSIFKLFASIDRLAQAEDLPAHAWSARLRYNNQ